jgi:hypothetical protein
MAHTVGVPQSQFCRLRSNPFKHYGSLDSMGKAREAGFSDSERRCNNLSWERAPTTSAAGAAMSRDLSCLDSIRSAICMALSGYCTSFYAPRVHTVKVFCAIAHAFSCDAS